MSSSGRSELLDLERDLPTTEEDVEALRRARERPPADTAAYLRFLVSLPAPPAGALRTRRGPCGERFDLLAPRTGRP